MGVPSPRSSPRRAGAAHASGSSTSLGLVLAGVACLAAVAVGSFGLTTEATLGIDLGTTFSVAATCERGIVTVVRVPGGSGTHAETMPSVVHFPERAREAAMVGADAARRRDTHPSRTVYDAKRLIGRRVDDPVVAEETKHLPFAVVAGDGGFAAVEMDEATRDESGVSRDKRLIAPEAVGAVILSRLKAAAERGDGGAASRWKRRLGFRFRTVTVSVPVNFSREQKAATMRAARAAGFAAARLLEEPVAAALARFGAPGKDQKIRGASGNEKRRDGGALVLVYDLGGGTLDVAVLRAEPSSGTFLVMGTAGDDRLGGEDFDRALLEWARGKLADSPEPILFPDAERWNDDSGFARGVAERALREMERAKRRLSDAETARIDFAHEIRAFAGEKSLASSRVVVDVGARRILKKKTDGFDRESASLASSASETATATTTLTLTRSDLESACAALLDRAVEPVYDALRDAGGVGAAEITDVVLVGGSSRLTAVRARLAAIFGDERLAAARGEGELSEPDPETAVAVGAARSYAC